MHMSKYEKYKNSNSNCSLTVVSKDTAKIFIKIE